MAVKRVVAVLLYLQLIFLVTVIDLTLMSMSLLIASLGFEVPYRVLF